MKNIIHLKNIEDLPINTLSLIIRGKHAFTTKPYNNWMKYNRRRDYHGKVGNISLRKFVGNLLERSIGKPFDDVFSYFCIKAPKFSQKIFLEEFKPYKINDENYIIDENGLIQENPLYPKWRKFRDLTYRSDDFEQEFRHKITGEKGNAVDLRHKRDNNEAHRWKYKCFHKGCDHNNCGHRYEDYEWVTIKGWSKTFEKWSDPEFKKLRIAKHWRKENAYKKRKRKSKPSFEITLISGEEERRRILKHEEQMEKWRLQREEYRLAKAKKEEEENLIKIIAHGFDPIKSFRGFKIR